MKIWEHFIGIGCKLEIMFAFAFISFGYIQSGRKLGKMPTQISITINYIYINQIKIKAAIYTR
ncbi:hypothetical protein HMPREF2557_06825 [Neisseria sp. HMSC064F03]|nr:hypothetical protein HMPREF2675_02000 [Neisseria sp. HMSC061H08]OHQ13969.1 hypothetical protein HMPREF2557_06825 [Neisseria sp. HMSC064F03]